ncbi:acetyltransferase [Vibrio parahaemolyticus]|nr:acetyltransferase [Vibrio parahaemolyticus]EGR3228414.1 acetyltransferase [Vibrio parahaemolyticus]
MFKVQWFRLGGWRCSPLNAALCSWEEIWNKRIF